MKLNDEYPSELVKQREVKLAYFYRRVSEPGIFLYTEAWGEGDKVPLVFDGYAKESDKLLYPNAWKKFEEMVPAPQIPMMLVPRV